MHFKDFKFYIKDKLVLSFSDYEVKKGVNLIFGPSGSGKTTFFKFLYILANKGPEYIGKFLGNFVKYEGQVQIDDKVEVCFQEFSLINDLSVKDNFKIFWGGNIQKIYPLLEYFLLPNKILEDRAGNLSGGEKARISFILSWIRAQKYLLIDEADSYLNKELKQKLYKFLKENSSNKTILFATHNEDLKNVFYHYFSIEN